MAIERRLIRDLAENKTAGHMYVHTPFMSFGSSLVRKSYVKFRVTAP